MPKALEIGDIVPGRMTGALYEFLGRGDWRLLEGDQFEDRPQSEVEGSERRPTTWKPWIAHSLPTGDKD